MSAPVSLVLGEGEMGPFTRQGNGGRSDPRSLLGVLEDQQLGLPPTPLFFPPFCLIALL